MAVAQFVFIFFSLIVVLFYCAYTYISFFLSFCRSCLYFGSFCVRMGEEIDINVVSLNKRMCVLFWLCIKLQNIIRNTNIHTLNSLKWEKIKLKFNKENWRRTKQTHLFLYSSLWNHGKQFSVLFYSFASNFYVSRFFFQWNSDFYWIATITTTATT